MKTTAAFAIALLATLAGPYAPAAGRDAPDTIAYLGVAAGPVEPMLARHLKLKSGAGLTVMMVDEKSAADGLLEVEDILTELDGQILVNSDQFVTLVRMQKPGQEVTLKLLRAGAEKTIKVKLGERAAPDEMEQRFVPPTDPRFDLFRYQRMMPDAWNMPNWPQPQPRDPALRAPRRGESRTDTQVQMRSTAVLEMDGRRAELTDDGQTRRFKVTEDNGKKSLYDAEVKGDADVEKMPKVVRELYDQLNQNTKIELRTREQDRDDQPEREERGRPSDRIST